MPIGGVSGIYWQKETVLMFLVRIIRIFNS